MYGDLTMVYCKQAITRVNVVHFAKVFLQVLVTNVLFLFVLTDRR